MTEAGELLAQAEALASALKRRRLKLVLAESCTGGLIAATLAQVPGVSDHFCGSAVTYRDDTKSRWLGIPAALIRKHTAVSPEVAIAMARGALKKTPEADLAAAVTGHFGPDAPAGQDGLVYISMAFGDAIFVQELRLTASGRSGKLSAAARRKRGAQIRRERQLSTSLELLFMVRSLLESKGPKSRGARGK